MFISEGYAPLQIIVPTPDRRNHNLATQTRNMNFPGLHASESDKFIVPEIALLTPSGEANGMALYNSRARQQLASKASVTSAQLRGDLDEFDTRGRSGYGLPILFQSFDVEFDGFLNELFYFIFGITCGDTAR